MQKCSKLVNEAKILYWKWDVAFAKGFDFAGNIVDSIIMTLFRSFVTLYTNVEVIMMK